MVSLNLTAASFQMHCRIFISTNIIFVFYPVVLIYAKPNISNLLFKINIIEFTNHFNLNWNIKNIFSPKQMTIFKEDLVIFKYYCFLNVNLSSIKTHMVDTF